MSKLVPSHLLERAAKRFRILSEPLRLQILNMLMVESEMSVMELVDATGQQQANISKHLALLANEQILARRKDGVKVYYSLDDPSIHGICTLVCGQLEQLQNTEATR
ncbi:MAG: ArsR/SmtB family transcription factor [Calditrichia bacterium]